MDNLDHFNLVDTIVIKGYAILGICLGLQLLFEKSDETPRTERDLEFLKEILRIPPKEGLKVPHMGWNSLNIKHRQGCLTGANNSYVYFVHSYYLKAEDENSCSLN